MDDISREVMAEFDPGPNATNDNEQETFLESGERNHHHHRMTSSGSNSAPSAPSCAARRRSLSVASAMPSVETVVVKAKRAASSLWLLLHAQKCTLAGKCPTPGCKEAKLLHLHLKTCPAKEGHPCPTEYNGCRQSRKLLAHYRRCRSIRVKQAGQPTKGNEQHHCLVCSLVARQARSMLDRSASKSLRKHPSSKHSVMSSLMSPASTTTSSNKTKNHLHKDRSSSSSSSLSSSLCHKMPPPVHSRRQLLSSSTKVTEAGLPNIQSIALAVDPSLDEERQASHRHYQSSLGSSLDSVRDSALRARSASVAVETSGFSQPHELQTADFARQRSASVGGATLVQQRQAATAATSGSGSLLKGCDTIQEEGCCSDTSCSSVDKSDFELGLTS